MDYVTWAFKNYDKKKQLTEKDEDKYMPYQTVATEIIGSYINKLNETVTLVHDVDYAIAPDTFMDSYGYIDIDDSFVYHRIGEPSFCNKSDGYITWDVEGREYDEVRKYCKACGFDEETTVFWLLKYGDFLPTNLDQL